MDSVLRFWFDELTPKQWFTKDASLDKTIKERFGTLHDQAIRGELYLWRSDPEGRLAEIILLDQFSRNIFRDTAQAFAFDGMAVVLAQEAIHSGDDLLLSDAQRSFIYMPLMHSESSKIHELALLKFTELGNPLNLEYEIKHKEIIDRFGRYPHRNALLGRKSTLEELRFLETPGSSF